MTMYSIAVGFKKKFLIKYIAIRDYCTADEFACCAKPQQCIELHRRCDGHRDCSDGDDEINCRKSID